MAAVGGHLYSHLYGSDAADLDDRFLAFVDLALDVGEGSFNLVNQNQA